MNLKRGATFDFSGPVQAMDGGQAVTDFTGWQARSQVRTVGGAGGGGRVGCRSDFNIKIG